VRYSYADGSMSRSTEFWLWCARELHNTKAPEVTDDAD